jgi:hypothetical protein
MGCAVHEGQPDAARSRYAPSDRRHVGVPLAAPDFRPVCQELGRLGSRTMRQRRRHRRARDRRHCDARLFAEEGARGRALKTLGDPLGRLPGRAAKVCAVVARWS